MKTGREAVLDALDRWRGEGLLDEATHRRLRERAESEPRDPPRASFAVRALQLVGGLLLGAALVALAAFLELEPAPAAWTMLGLGAVPLAAGAALHVLGERGRLEGREGLAEALLAAGLVPIAGSPVPLDGLVHDPRPLGLVAAGLAVAAYALRRGRGPSALAAAAAWTVALFGGFAPGALGGSGGYDAFALLGLLLALGGLLLAHRRDAWTSLGLGLYVGPLAGAYAAVLDRVGVHGDTQTQLAFALLLGVLFTVGALLGERGLVAGSALGLTIDAVAFAVDVSGPGGAVVLLLALGSILVWQAEFLRAYFRRRAA